MQLQSRPKCRGGQTESPAWPGSLRRASLCAGRRFQGRSSPAPSPSPSQPELAAPTLSRVTVRSSLAEAADAASRHAATTTTPSPPNSQPASPAEPPETVTRHNFAAALPVIRAAIRDATFVAIDAEFTGLSPEGNGGEELLDDYEERYRRIANAASSFVIGQFGISAFKWVPPTSSSGSRGGGGGGVGHWEARTFNVYVFPRPLDGLGLDRRFMCQASSLTYLAEQGFDFNKMIRDGVGYLPLSYRDAKAAGLAEQADNQARSSELKGEEEEVLAEETRRVVREWLMGGEAELQVKLPPTRRLRTLQRLLVQQEFQLPSAGWQPFSLEEFYPLGPTAAAAAAAAAPSQPQGISSVGSSSALDGEEDGPGGGGSSSGDDEDGVCMLPAASGSGSGGAFVQLSRPELVSRALAAARKRWVGWTVMTYAEYAASRRQKSGGGNGSGAGGGAAGAGAKADAGRASPRLIGGQRAAAAVAGGVTAAAAPGGSVGGVEATGGAAAAATGRAAEAVGASEGAAAGTSAAGAGKAVGGLDSERKRLKAFTRRVAAVSAGLPPAPPTAPAAPEDGVEKQEAEAAGVAAAVAAAAASESGSASSATVADAAAAAQAAAKQAAEAEAEAARQAAEKLYSLARAAEKLRGGLGAGAGQDGSGSSSGGGSSSSSGGSGAALGLQRPGRPGRKL
ncbi:hypothetical protein CHLRE_02g090276v5 [Chlamydomonas reinhardtii]|uniref:Uncharacterized protein n=1 Tax=Chlamydomonas reinhardtii TaxID=3055 RepID=A0A2K3E197_CHLRE|nr:uncharacterized protein CHLRE_02g090276v5 [Chlamydomonas reinhardtii]PNW86527.1 hypothetical protein CHLRE_02g090276v5 [Chlamydomonas reinhardtii]